MEIRNLEHTDFETIFHGFKKAFADYEIHFEKEEVRSMLKRRGYNRLFYSTGYLIIKNAVFVC